jgi:hypothetical protein
MDRRTAVPDAASVAPSNDRRAVRREANNRRAGPPIPGVISAEVSNGHRAAPHVANRRTLAPATPDAISAARSFGHRTVPNRGRRVVHRATSARTGRAMMDRAMMALVPMSRVPMARTPAARDQRARAIGGSHFRRVRVRMTVAVSTLRIVAMIARSTAPRRRTHRAARSGCMACTRLPPRWPTRRGACAAWC